MSKFYHLVGAARAVAAGSFLITFYPYERTSTWLGVYEATDEKQIEALDALIKENGDKKTALTEIDEKEYQKCIKKKVAAGQGYTQSLAQSTPTPGVKETAGFAGKPVEADKFSMLPPPEKPKEAEVLEPVPVEKKTE
jgi:hypothetical protein